MDLSLVTVGVTDGVASVTMGAPPANALSYALIGELEAACDVLDQAAVGCAVFRSSLDAFFAAGADLKLLTTLDAGSFAAYLTRLRAVLERIASSTWSSIAAIDGHALGGGLELAMACTFRVVTERARLGLPEVKLGVLPGAGGTQRTVRLVGRGRALELLTSGRSVDGVEAVRIGLADLVADDADGEAQRWARGLADGPRDAVRAIVRCVDAAAEAPAHGMAVEAAEVIALFDSPDGQEGIAAFIQKRPAVFGRHRTP